MYPRPNVPANASPSLRPTTIRRPGRTQGWAVWAAIGFLLLAPQPTAWAMMQEIKSGWMWDGFAGRYGYEDRRVIWTGMDELHTKEFCLGPLLVRWSASHKSVSGPFFPEQYTVACGRFGTQFTPEQLAGDVHQRIRLIAALVSVCAGLTAWVGWRRRRRSARSGARESAVLSP
jgi:hypothetical protein